MTRWALGGALVALLVAPLLLVMAGLSVEDQARADAIVPGLDGTGIPVVAQEAYSGAAASAQTFNPPCQVPAWILAGIGEVESGHGTHGGSQLGADGVAAPPIIGIPLTGAGGTASVPDTDDGALDGDPAVDRAVGPMQFIPSTWAAHGQDGDGDGRADPQNIYDAALTAAAYLCVAGSPMATEADWRRGLLAYNRSEAYVAEVLQAAYGYRDAPSVAPIPGGGPVPLALVQGVPMHAALAPIVARMIDDAAGDGVALRIGNSYRDVAQQIELRRQHCGSSYYAIYEMPSSQCSPPTARPGSSMHQQGLAIDWSDCSSRSTACYRWLDANAHRYGLYNLPSEPWHWSTDGT